VGAVRRISETLPLGLHPTDFPLRFTERLDCVFGVHWRVRDTGGQEYLGPSPAVADHLIQAVRKTPGSPGRRLGAAARQEEGGNQMKFSFESEEVQNLLSGAPSKTQRQSLEVQ
jgi:hypothetical protein